MRVRSARCPTCGAPKVTPYTNAYVYCDFCGRLMDFDAAVAKYDRGRAAGPHYRDLLASLAGELEAARAASDREALAGCHRKLFDQYITDMPHSYSVRIGDPVYRAAILERQVWGTVICELAPAYEAAKREVEAAMKDLDWDMDYTTGKQTAHPVTFWRLFEVAMAFNALGREICADNPGPPDPDDTPDELAHAMTASIWAQTWVSFLDDESAAELLRRTGMESEYAEVEPPPLHRLACAQCSAPRDVPEGATRSVCDACGHTPIVGTTLGCTRCGASVTIPVGRLTAHCESCQTEARLMVAR